MSPGPVVLIDAFAVPDERDEAFLARDYLATQDHRRKAHDIARQRARAF